LNLGAGLEGKGVIVTGAAGGIGREVVKSFAAVGAKVLAVDVDEKRTAEALDGIEGDGHLAVGDDLTDLASHGRLVRLAEERLGGVRAFAHLAAVLKRRARLDDVTEEDFDLQVGTNLKASFFLTRAVADSMIAAGSGGAIVLFSSQGWWTGGFGGSVVYNATKGAIVTMTRGLARTLGPEKITVNSVAPGQVETSMLLTDLDPAIYERMKRDTPLGYVAQPSEIAGTVVFLASDHARYISGATVNVSGGFLMY
jgi:NAD(P)-dependent dehydrogenase (short-subunit alcohol dehydrogenase family)